MKMVVVYFSGKITADGTEIFLFQGLGHCFGECVGAFLTRQARSILRPPTKHLRGGGHRVAAPLNK
ncbi:MULTISPECIES: hypothetical protein [Raoultella]|uniref:hypothetical protein n=1 Tax=Raoultella TaxID=160674 RepID=UPI002167EF45|nr:MULTISPECIES: hypothetical protein [Raoultella]MCS4273057.1 hypothetical protein [Raoultella sp. BIGb0132]MCS4289571.1 hypothetical protein [Raoultella terrigena]